MLWQPQNGLLVGGRGCGTCTTYIARTVSEPCILKIARGRGFESWSTTFTAQLHSTSRKKSNAKMLSVACVFAVSIAMPTTLRHASQDSCQTTTNTCHPCNKNCAVLNKTFSSSPADCCEQCSKTAGCASWTYTLNGAASLSCHLKCTCASRRWFTIQVACLPPLILPPQHLLFLF